MNLGDHGFLAKCIQKAGYREAHKRRQHEGFLESGKRVRMWASSVILCGLGQKKGMEMCPFDRATLTEFMEPS